MDAETRRLVEEALDSASALLDAHRATLDRLAERLCEHETVNGSEVTAMLMEASIADASVSHDATMWRVRKPRTDLDLTPKVSVLVGKTGSGNGHEPEQASSCEQLTGAPALTTSSWMPPAAP